jgi:hypothetical protein
VTDELAELRAKEAKRKADADRQQARRDRLALEALRTTQGPSAQSPQPQPAPVADRGTNGNARASGSVLGAPSLPLHATRRLEDIGTTPDDPRYQRTPPTGVAVPPPTASAPTAADIAGAAKVAGVVAFMFKHALDDATVRYELASFGAAFGIELGATEVEAAKGGAVKHVFECTQRACIKHGIGLSIPYEDEATAIAAALGSAGYLIAMRSGRLDRKEDGERRRQQPKQAAPTVIEVDGVDDGDVPREKDGTLRMEAVA